MKKVNNISNNDETTIYKHKNTLNSSIKIKAKPSIIKEREMDIAKRLLIREQKWDDYTNLQKYKRS